MFRGIMKQGLVQGRIVDKKNDKGEIIKLKTKIVNRFNLIRGFSNANYGSFALVIIQALFHIKTITDYLSTLISEESDLGSLFKQYFDNSSMNSMTVIQSVHSKFLNYDNHSAMDWFKHLLIAYPALNKVINSTIANLNSDICKFVQWSRDVGLTLNSSKTKFMILGSNFNLLKIESISLSNIIVDNSIIPRSDKVKNLGVIISQDLTWNEHINSILSTTNKIFFFLNNKCFNLPFKIRKNLVTSLLFPHFDYCCLVYSSLTKFLDNKIAKAFRRAVRFIFRIHKSENTDKFFLKLNWLSPETRRRYFLGTLIYKVLTTKRPIYLYNELEPSFSTNHPNTRNCPPFDIPFASSSTYQNSFLISSMHLWNTLPSEIRNCETLPTFKNKLHNNLINSQNF